MENGGHAALGGEPCGPCLIHSTRRCTELVLTSAFNFGTNLFHPKRPVLLDEQERADLLFNEEYFKNSIEPLDSLFELYPITVNSGQPIYFVARNTNRTLKLSFQLKIFANVSLEREKKVLCPIEKFKLITDSEP